MSGNIKISITIPSYKDNYFKEAIDSVLSQTYENYEIIIVNDASPCDLDSIVNLYNDSRIRYYKNKKNCGAKNVVDNWNICLSYATGDYLICMGDDDKLKPECLQLYVDLINKYPNLNLYHVRTELINAESKVVCVLEERPEWESVYSLIFHHRNSFIGDWLFKTDILRSNGGFYKLPYGWESDYISAYIAADNLGVANTNQIGYQYRGNPYSISCDMSCVEDKIDAIHSSIEWQKDFIANSHPESIEDQRLIELIKKDGFKVANREIEEMIEFDIRKNMRSRSFYWLKQRNKVGLSFFSYFRCLLKAIKYK